MLFGSRRLRFLTYVGPESPVIALDILPMDATRSDAGPNVLQVIYLRMPRRPEHPSKALSNQDDDGTRQAWLSAFRKSLRWTLRSISDPTDSQSCTDFSHLEHLKVTQLTTDLMVASGLPLPKSPSLQIQDTYDSGRQQDVKTQEREERGWWSLRFQQVLMEFQRQEALFPLPEDNKVSLSS